jgi:adenylosuccinate synthase
VGALDADSLPPRAREYVSFIEQELEAEVALISTGPRREETIVRDLPALRRLTSGRLAAPAGSS